MTQNNPYKYGSDLDDDIFETEKESKSGEKVVHRHTLDGSVCHTCQIVHSVEGLPTNLPEAVMEKLLSFIDTIPDEILKRADGLLAAAVPPQTRLITDFMNFLFELDIENAQGPLLRSVVEFLDEQSGGAVTQRWEVYELERRLIASHLALKSVNVHLDDARGTEAPEDVLSLLEFLMDFMVDRISTVTMKYREKAEAAGVAVNEALINSGSYGDSLTGLTKCLMIDSVTDILD